MPFDFYPRIYTDEYYCALGQFVSDFSEVEQSLQIVLWHFSGVKSPIAQAVFSGVRADDAANKITRIGVAQKWSEERKAEWKAICDRLGAIKLSPWQRGTSFPPFIRCRTSLWRVG